MAALAIPLTIDPVNDHTFNHGNHKDAESSTVVVHQLQHVHATLLAEQQS